MLPMDPGDLERQKLLMLPMDPGDLERQKLLMVLMILEDP
jgi:hypothetical protein